MMQRILRLTPVFAKTLIRSFVILMLSFLSFRFLFLIFNADAIPNASVGLIAEATLRGWQFDLCVSAYLLVLPYLLIQLAEWVPALSAFCIRGSRYLLWTTASITLFLVTADIPYYSQFGTRINPAALLWKDDPGFVLGMLFSESRYWLYLLLFVVCSLILFQMLKRIYNNARQDYSDSIKVYWKVLVSVILLAMLLIGMRGRLGEKATLKTGAAYFSDNGFVNQYTLNPAFVFFYSLAEDLKEENRNVTLMKPEIALEQTKKYLGSAGRFRSPVARKVVSDSAERPMNIVLVIMEGMSRFNMGKYNGPSNITPVLDSLKNNSLWFENIYTQGIHTHNGIFSTLYSYPALLKKHPMASIPSKPYYAIPAVLKERKYRNVLFVSHDGQFDNTEGFLMANSFDRVYSQKDYPSEKVLSTLGVPDDYLFEYSISELNAIYESGQRFFCGFMTGSNHRPLVFPDWANVSFTSTEDEYKMVEYADWSIGQFLTKASLQPWYRKTIFVFVADHGMSFGHTYDMPLSFHHTPLIIHAPGISSLKGSSQKFGGQIDILPTVLGLMNYSYTNNTFGIDLLTESRPCTYFTADDKIGCIEKDYYFVHRINGIESLYRYEDLSTTNYLEQQSGQADSLRNYAFSMLQAAQEINRQQLFSKEGIE